MTLITNTVTPGLAQPSVVYAAEESANPQQGTETPASIVLGKGTIEINGHLFTNEEFLNFLNNAKIVRIPFEKPSAFTLGEYDDLVENGTATAGGLTVLAGSLIGIFQKLSVIFNLADLQGSAYKIIGDTGGVTLPLIVRLLSDKIEINGILIDVFNKALADLTNFLAEHKNDNPDEEIVNPDAGSGETAEPGEGTGDATHPDINTETEPRENHKVRQQGVDLPPNGALDKNGEANSSEDLLDQNGELKQRRYYDEKGQAEKDIDYKHADPDGSHTFPHVHYWDWSDPKNPIRLK